MDNTTIGIILIITLTIGLPLLIISIIKDIKDIKQIKEDQKNE